MKSQALRENANQKQLVNAKYNNLNTVCRKTDSLFYLAVNINLKTCKKVLFIILFFYGDMAKW